MATYKITVNLSWSGEGGPGVNVFHYRDPSGVTDGSDVQGAIDALQAFYTGCLGIFSNDAVIECPSEVIRDPYGTPEYFGVDGWVTTGQGGVNKAPAATAVCVGWRTASATRAGRGRTFLSPITVSAVDANGTINNTQLAAVQNAAQTLVDWGQDEPLNGSFGVWSGTQGVLRDFVATRTQDRFAVLRSRRD